MAIQKAPVRTVDMSNLPQLVPLPTPVTVAVIAQIFLVLVCWARGPGAQRKTCGDLGVDERVNHLVEEPGSHLPAKGPGTRIIMAAVSGVPVVLAPAHGTKGAIHYADGWHSVCGQINKEWN